MQFVPNGPKVPDILVQAHEEGRVVFFSGAGISYPAGLPGFEGLVRNIYGALGAHLNKIEQAAFDRGQFDATLDLLERRYPGGRRAVRQALAQTLKPQLRRKGAIATQAALLRLGRDREGALRLVTTNFDRVFHAAAKRSKQVFNTYAAPMLPIPKNSRWNGLVFLHGLLTKEADEASLNRLVVTSGDFGLAYLTERWAARFVSELFRSYVVCFVGYSINDPVLRYMMDALAADRRQGETLPTAWAFADCEPGHDRRTQDEWEAKGVTPILYQLAAHGNEHHALHDTLQRWAEIYRDGVSGKEHVVVEYALANPSRSTAEDDFVSRMLWAISDNSGLPAQRFAEFNPVPPLDWLKAFSDECFQHGDLPRFGVEAQAEADDTLRFSLTRRPAPYGLTPPMSLVSSGTTASGWDRVMSHFARWLLRHLDDPRLVIWIAEHGGQLDERWIRMVDGRLDELTSLEREGRVTELGEIQAQAPKAIPSSLMRTLWRLLLSGRVKALGQDHDLYRWKTRFKRDGLTTTLRLELRELLAPKVTLRQPFHRDGDTGDPGEPTRISQLVNAELVLTADHARSALQDLQGSAWSTALSNLLPDFQQLLCDALDLLRELGEANDRYDRSHLHMPSISPHWQNRGFRDWTCLIELVRDAWLAIRKPDGSRTRRIAEEWFDLPYPTFKRLALFAASQDDCVASEQWVDWLATDRAWWLWSPATKREFFRLLALQGAHLTVTAQDHLEAAILAGPPRDMYRADLDAATWSDLVSHSIWLRLSKLKTFGIVLGDDAAHQLAKISAAHPLWRLADNESDEFSHWMSGTGDPGFDAHRKIETTPRTRRELVPWLRKPMPQNDPFYEDSWRDVCSTRFFHSLSALCDLSKHGKWPAERWRAALQAWAGKDIVARSWHYAAPLVQNMPDTVLQEVIHAVTWWIAATSKSTTGHEDILLNLSDRILALPLDADSTVKSGDGGPLGDPVTEAINHPVGHITDALVNLWFRDKPSDDDQLPGTIKPFFSSLCNASVAQFRHGRVLLASRAIALFRVDRAWTERRLLPLFDWSIPVEAKAVWAGFLWSPRLYQPLLIAFKTQFLDCARHYAALGRNAQRYATFLTYAALGPVEGYSTEEFRVAAAALPQEGLEESARALSQALEGAGDQREEYWKNRVQPFWHNIWPKARNIATPQVAEHLARMALAARSEFPAALAATEDWLKPIQYPYSIVCSIKESGLCKQFPSQSLRLLGIMVRDLMWISSELRDCLDQILQADPSVTGDPTYQRLLLYVRQQGG